MMAAGRTPDEQTELAALARREHRAGRLAEAAAAYRQVLAIGPTSPHASTTWATCWWSRASSTRPRHISHERSLSSRFRRRHTTTWAISFDAGQTRRGGGPVSSKRWLSGRTTPRRTTTWAISSAEQGKLDQAAARYEQALALRPDYAEAHNNLGNVC